MQRHNRAKLAAIALHNNNSTGMSIVRNWHHFLLFALFLLTPPTQAADSVTSGLFQITSQVLPNGLHVIRHHRDISDTFTAQLIVDVGLQDFTCEEQQLPHLLEHMLFEGTSRFDRQTLRQRVRDHGGRHNGYTTEEYTHYTVDIHSDFADIALENLYSMVSEPLLLPAHLETSRQVVHAEQGTSSNSLQLAMSGKKDLHRMAKARLFAGSHLACPDFPLPDRITMERLREVFGQFYVASNMTLLLIGHFDDAHIDQVLEITLARLPARPVPQRHPVQFSPVSSRPLVAKNSLFDPEVDVSLYLRTVGSTHPSYPAFEIAAEYLGEQLFYQVRGEKGMAYTPYAYVESNSQFGFLRANTKTTDRWHDDVVELFRSQYQQLRSTGIPAADIERLRRKLILEFESRQRDNSQVAQTYRHFRHVIRERGNMPDLIAKLQNITVEQVNAALRRHLPEEPLLAIARPPSVREALFLILPAAAMFGGLGVFLLRWNRRRGAGGS